MSIVYSTKERDWRVSSKTNRATVEQTKIHNNAQMGPIAPPRPPHLVSLSLFLSNQHIHASPCVHRTVIGDDAK